jgi:hypothetical protein
MNKGQPGHTVSTASNDISKNQNVIKAWQLLQSAMAKTRIQEKSC